MNAKTKLNSIKLDNVFKINDLHCAINQMKFRLEAVVVGIYMRVLNTRPTFRTKYIGLSSMNLTSNSGVMHVGVVGIGHPERGRSDVVVLETRTRDHEDGQVVLEHVARLHAVLQEERT